MPDEDTIDVYEKIQSSADTPTGKQLNRGYIAATVIFITPGQGDGTEDTEIVASPDVISISTDQGNSKQEGDATAKLTVTLSNNNNFYAGKLIPQMSEVQSWITVERNIVNGSSLTVEKKLFPLYYGVVQEVQLNHETCTVECGDESSKMECSDLYDLTFFPDQTAYQRATDILDSIDPRPNLNIKDLSTEAQNIQIESFMPATQSGQSNMSEMLKAMSLDWAVPSDRWMRLIIFNKEINWGVTDWGDITEFVVDAGDSESIIGFCNVVTIIADGHNVSALGLDKNLASSDSGKSFIEFPTPEEQKTDESILKYGRLESPAYTMPNLSTTEEIENFATNLLDLYASYEDRTLTPTIVSFIPFLNDKFNYTIHGTTTPPLSSTQTSSIHPGAETPVDRDIYVKMLRKQVTYDSGGVVVQTECFRKGFDEEEGDPSDDVMLDKKATKYWDTIIGDTYTLWYKDEDGNIYVKYGATEQEMLDFINDNIKPDGFELYDDPANFPGLDNPYD